MRESMSLNNESTVKYVCWSCGVEYPSTCACTTLDCEGPVMQTKIPSNPPPYCGGSSEENDQIIFTNYVDRPAMRTCCNCHQSWMCTREEWKNGVCPQCGAYGEAGLIEETITKNFQYLNMYTRVVIFLRRLFNL